MFVFARDWRLALPLLFGPTLRCLGISLYCLLTFNFGNERTQSRHRYEITRATRSRHLYESVPFSRSLREKETRLNILFPKSSGSFLRSKKLSLRFARSKKAIPKIVSRYFRNSGEGEFLLLRFRKIDGSLSRTGTEFKNIPRLSFAVSHRVRVHFLPTSVFAACVHTLMRELVRYEVL